MKSDCAIRQLYFFFQILSDIRSYRPTVITTTLDVWQEACKGAFTIVHLISFHLI